MKTRHAFGIAFVILSLFLTNRLFAQENTKIDTLPTVYIFSHSVVNNAVHKAFRKDFKDAVSARWYQADQNFLVKFMSKDQKNHVLYNSKGSIVYHLTYFTGNNLLPNNIFGLVNAKYTDAKVLTAIHVEQDNRSIWVVNLKVGGEIVIARVEEEQVEELQRYTDTSV